MTTVAPDGLLGACDSVENLSRATVEPPVEIQGMTVLAEPTADCNLACSYCYKGRKSPRCMSIDTAHRLLSEIVGYNSALRAPTLIVWHGGEPSLAGLDFYQNVFSYAASLEAPFPVRHTMQTNGTLLDDSLLDLFAHYHVSIGVSLDGPADYHDAVRPLRGGEPTHGRIMDALSRARKRGIDVGILMSIGRGNARYVPQMFHFCREHGFDLGLNPVTRDLHAAHPESEVSPSVYLEACKDAFDLWFYQADAPIQVNPGCGVMRHLLSRARLSDCSMCDNCQLHFISVGPEGDVYPCNRFYAVPGYTFGNIRIESLQKILASPTRAHLLARSAERIDHCRECSIRSLCNGGCMHHALAHFQQLDAPDHLCEVYRGLVEHAVARLSEVLWRSPSQTQ